MKQFKTILKLLLEDFKIKYLLFKEKTKSNCSTRLTGLRLNTMKIFRKLTEIMIKLHQAIRIM